MASKKIVVLGGGFAGLWSAVGAARKLDELKVSSDDVEVILVNRDEFHGIRVRNYETDITDARLPLDTVLRPIGVTRVEGNVAGIDLQNASVTINSNDDEQRLCFDRLVFALGSQLVRPNIPGLADHSFDVDTYRGAARLENHLQRLPNLPASTSQWTAVVVGGGLTGIEIACEMGTRLRAIQPQENSSHDVRVILVDHKPWIGSDMGDSARPVIDEALKQLGVETRVGVRVVAMDENSIALSSSEIIPAATVIWCAGVRANPLTSQFPVTLDGVGRLPVDEYLRVREISNVFAAGDSAAALLDASHRSVMSCQHSRPMGRFAGHNVVCDLLGQPMLPLHIDWYVTVLDLGPWGAVYTTGWDRTVFAQGAAAKTTKQEINHRRIYPPMDGNREAILAAAAPVVQAPPARGSQEATGCKSGTAVSE